MPSDPYKYFRVEARELLDGLTAGVLELEQGLADHERIGNLLRLAHTLKGAARVVKQPAMADLAHGIEDVLSPFRERTGPISAESARAILQMLDQISNGLAALTPAGHSPSPNAPTMPPDQTETVRVEVEQVEMLLTRLGELGAGLAEVERETETLNLARKQASFLIRQLEAHATEIGPFANRVLALAGQLQDSLHLLSERLALGAGRMDRELSQGREIGAQLRLLPSASVFPTLERGVHDAATALGKQVRLEFSGGKTRLDADVLMGLRDALLQLLRNAVAHGIEDAAERESAGKARCGRIDLKIERRGNRVAFLCRDDGAGINLASIRRVAVKKGIITPVKADKLELQEAIDLIFRAGLSTSGELNEIAGRGIGLDIVRSAVSRLKGEIAVQTSPGLGTSIEILVPVSLSSMTALTVASGKVVASLPFDCIRQTLRVDESEIVRCGAQESIAYQGTAIPFLPLSAVLGTEETDAVPRRHWTAMIIASGDRLAAIGVDRLISLGTVLVRALPALAPASRVVNGATVDKEGNPQLFLDPAGLVEFAANGRQPAALLDASSTPVLVIDDSLTTRMVEQSILESAGYRVDVAISGEEALAKALEGSYRLFLVDVEMPGMDGFEFISRARAHPALCEIPAILVTSRMSPEDRRRGDEVGAVAYMVKSEFDQNHFLKTIQGLVRRPK